MEKVNYKDTLNLPRTGFSMKANLPNKEPEILEKWEAWDIYRKITSSRAGSGRSFILHDGPPYANGRIHMGHVLNKILKDICVKYYAMKGFFSPYVPGWDCHGLPVEHQLFKELDMTKHDIDQVAFRKKAYDYAMKYVGIQAEEFKRLGIFGDWENPYLTLSRDYEADILLALADLYEKGYIYKDLKPVNWCARCETALAEAEVEYEDKESPSIFVKFRADKDERGMPVFFVIWTTTPWTLIANAAVALHPDFSYSMVETGGEVWIMESELAPGLMEKFGNGEYRVLKDLTGKEIFESGIKARHPFIERDSVIVLADYVTREEGTGCVHTAPGHGQEDHLTGKKYGLPVIMPVDAKGNFTAEAGEFSGHNVYKANASIIDSMRKQGSLIKDSVVAHSYPHCWRCKEPIIFRATEQWFMKIDHQGLRDKMIKAIDNDVEWIPPMGRDRIGSMVRNRPDWCLSRQRYWGVPIPAFRCSSCGEAFTSAGSIRAVGELTRKHGADVWFEKDIGDLIPGKAECPSCGSGEIQKESDILDVWFDSGVSHRAVLRARKELAFPCDLYLEGSDQHRGWFQSSLITSMASDNTPPYRKVLTHGFVVDGEGKKMSKSVGNVISPQDIMRDYGADILRLWVSSSDYEADIKLSGEILDRLADGYRKIRNTFRYLLSNLYDFDPSRDAVPPERMYEIDRWMLSRLRGLVDEVTGSYDNWEFHRVYRAVYDFCVYEVSAFYLDVLKDVLYILTPDSPERRSAQTALFRVLEALVRVMAPLLSFTSEEAWGFIERPGKAESVHTADWPDPEKEMSGWKDEVLDSKWEKLLGIRDAVMKMLETRREKGLLGSSLEAGITLYSDDKDMSRFIRDNEGLFPAVLKVSQAGVLEERAQGMEEAAGFPLFVGVEKARGSKCQRCWNWRETVGDNNEAPDICERCYKVIQERSRNGQEKIDREES